MPASLSWTVESSKTALPFALSRSASRNQSGSVKVRRRPTGRKVFDQFRNLVRSVVAGECGADRLRALSILRLDEYGADRLANLRGRWPAGAEIDAGAHPRDPRGYFRFLPRGVLRYLS